jgi:hypothetical protein
MKRDKRKIVGFPLPESPFSLPGPAAGSYVPSIKATGGMDSRAEGARQGSTHKDVTGAMQWRLLLPAGGQGDSGVNARRSGNGKANCRGNP